MEALAPDEPTPADCSTSFADQFNIQIQNVTTTRKRSIQVRQSNVLILSLSDGVLTDTQGRTGYIAANSQFQFDSPPQTGAIYTAGFSACNDGSLALGDSTIWWSCLSGNFYNLYSENILNAETCDEVTIKILAISDGTSSSTSSASTSSESSLETSSATSETVAIGPQPITSSATSSSTLRTTASSSLAGISPMETLDSPSRQDAPVNKSLSTGATAGIGVTVSLTALALLCIGFIYFRRRRRHRHHAGTSTPPYATHAVNSKHELDSTQVHEKDGTARKPELGNDGEIFEASERSKSDKESGRT